jgi:Flp pilus assembly pilin Flp
MMRALCRDRRGVSVVEFALVAPIILGIVMGGIELGHTMYVKSIFEGEMQKTGRDQTLEDAQSTDRRAAIEAKMRKSVLGFTHNGTIDFTQTAFYDYRRINNPAEDFVDADHDGICDAGEVYMDINNNARWDADTSLANNGGGAKDVVLYTAVLTYRRLPLGGFVGLGDVRMTAKTILRNQPFDQQAAPTERSCT